MVNLVWINNESKEKYCKIETLNSNFVSGETVTGTDATDGTREARSL